MVQLNVDHTDRDDYRPQSNKSDVHANGCTVASRGGTRDPFYDPWVSQASAPFHEPSTYAARALRGIYPRHSILLFHDSAGFHISEFPGATKSILSPPDFISSLVFTPFARSKSDIPGTMTDNVRFGAYSMGWNKFDFIVYILRYPQGNATVMQHYILHEGPEKRSRDFLMAAAAWAKQLHQEIYVLERGIWSKNGDLWDEVQKANWDDIILKQKFKDDLRKDISGFFDSKKLYKSLAIPWKRGIIMLGPPGNGKTITMKAIMKDCDALGYSPLYVKSFKHFMGEEYGLAEMFKKAREMAPCVLVLEDMDSLIHDGIRSFFLNQLDGFEGNDGLLMIGSTNHFERLDPALSGRPSRFDRKYSFGDPDQEERTLYAKYWQDKLESNKRIAFPDGLVGEIAISTNGFSFAYLKEVFVSTLVLLADLKDGDTSSFARIIREQIKALRKQLKKSKAGNTGVIDHNAPLQRAALPARQICVPMKNLYTPPVPNRIQHAERRGAEE